MLSKHNREKYSKDKVDGNNNKNQYKFSYLEKDNGNSKINGNVQTKEYGWYDKYGRYNGNNQFDRSGQTKTKGHINGNGRIDRNGKYIGNNQTDENGQSNRNGQANGNDQTYEKGITNGNGQTDGNSQTNENIQSNDYGQINENGQINRKVKTLRDLNEEVPEGKTTNELFVILITNICVIFVKDIPALPYNLIYITITKNINHKNLNQPVLTLSF